MRESDWSVAPAPPDLLDRRVEITGPLDRKMTINAMNSGARVFMADFEDALSPTWQNVVEGQRNLADAVRGTIELETERKTYRLNEEPAVLIPRPRGWHLHERHALVDGEPVSASLFDFGLAFFHNAAELLERGSGPYFYLPKLENHLEARLWNDAFVLAQDELGLDQGTIRATVLIETILAAFEMDEILYELRDHASGLNAGRWDYIFSAIKKFRLRPDFVLPDRAEVTMAVPFMRAYTELLVATCHRRGAHAMGGMAAFIPSRKDPEVNEVALAKVREDKEREAGDGFDGTWVAHPDLVPVATEIFDSVLGEEPNQVGRLRDDVQVSAAELLSISQTPGEVTDEGVATNVRVGIGYLDSWLRGVGAAAIDNLMEDVATAEISRSQLWQWVRHGRVSRERVLEEIAGTDAPAGCEGRLYRGHPGRRLRRFPDDPRLRAAMTTLERTKADEIALVLEEEIVSGELEPGQVLRQEEVSERFDVSRTPVREALRRLAALGLVSFVPNRGVRVRTITAQELREAFLVRAELESLATEIAAPRFSETELDELDAAEEAFSAATQALRARPREGVDRWRLTHDWVLANHGFHDVIYRVAESPLIERLAKSARRSFSGHAVWAPGGSETDALYERNDFEHKAIIAALRAGNPPGARMLAREHVMHSFELLTHVLERLGNGERHLRMERG